MDKKLLMAMLSVRETILKQEAAKARKPLKDKIIIVDESPFAKEGDSSQLKFFSEGQNCSRL